MSQFKNFYKIYFQIDFIQTSDITNVQNILFLFND